MLSRYFIERPIFAWVIAIVIMLLGLGAIRTLPIAQYPDIAPPSVGISATYTGADAQTVENSVTQVIEQQLTGLDGLLYFSSTSNSNGQASITATFANGTDPDIAQVQVQNKVQQALTRLPQQVQQQGLRVTKRQNDFLLVVGVYDETDRSTNSDVADFLVSNLQDVIGRISGVGDTNVFGSQYAMRIWLDPYKLASFQLMPDDVMNAIEAQNAQVSAGAIGGLPAPTGQQLTATVTAQSRLQTPEQFRNILVKTTTNGAQVRLSDVARVELGQESYALVSRFNRHPAAGIAVQLAPGADALETAEAVKAKVASLAGSLPPGYKVAYPRDSTAFIELSVEEVEHTLVEAMILVIAVMYLFLQSWRATLIPAIAIPVVLLGTFGVLALFGYSINTLTLFGMVLSIGLLVDDAIVVVENVERIMEEEGLSPHDATVKSMGEITGALVGIALVLSAVFLPMAFFGGSTGTIYRQFSITIVSSMALSVVVAIVLTPALCAAILKPHASGDRMNQRGFFGWFNRTFQHNVDRYDRATRRVIARSWLFMLVFAGVVALLSVLFLRLPTGFLPTEDNGNAMVQYTLPPGATRERTLATARAIENYVFGQEGKAVQAMFANVGGGFGTSGQNAGVAFLILKPWDQREGRELGAQAITRRMTMAFSGLRDAEVFALQPPAIQGLGQTNGFTMELLNTGSLGRAAFQQVRDQVIAAANQDPVLSAVRLSNLRDQPQLHVEVDNAKLAALGLAQADVSSTLSAAWGGTYVNDFIDRGRVKRVYVQGDAPYRAEPTDLDVWQVRGSAGTMAPFSAFAQASWTTGPNTLERFNGSSSYELQGQAAPGQSSGTAMDRMEEIAGRFPGVSVAWSGLSYQERLSSGQAPYLYAVSILVVFLCLAALYESWSIPISVLLVIPLGVIGAVLAVLLRGLENNVYFQVGLLTTIGLSAKNAILIVEFAEFAEREGKTPIEAAVEGARLRLRPIIMTSLAFIAGVMPLAVSTGAGAQSRVAIGTAVVGGMITATVLAIFFVPMFFVLVRRLFDRAGKHGPKAPDETPPVEENVRHDPGRQGGSQGPQGEPA